MSNVSRPVRIGTLVVLGYCSLLLATSGKPAKLLLCIRCCLMPTFTVAIVIARDTAPEDSTLQLPVRQQSHSGWPYYP